MKTPHQPVLLNQVLEVLRPSRGESYMDGTAGYGGHAAAVIEITGPKAPVILVERDAHAVQWLAKRFGERAEIIHGTFAEAAERFANGETDIVRLGYQNFISTFEQRPTLRTMFPLTLEELSKVVDDITPQKGVFAKHEKESAPSVYTVEPSEEGVLSVIVPKLAGIFLYHALLEGLASEHSARMVSMKSASDKAGEMKHSLTLQFNKARQAAITREVSEITGGMEAMAA